MTRNYEIDCRDLFECDHEPEVAVSDDGIVVAWHCRCGKVKVKVTKPPAVKPPSDGSAS